MTYQESKELALSLNKRINACNEYKAAYHFYEKTDYEVTGDNGVVILKDSGKAISWLKFIFDYTPEIEPVELDFEKGGIIRNEERK